MEYFIGKTDIGNFLKSREQFEKYRHNLETEQNRAGAIQAFEYTYETAWKAMKRILRSQGLVEASSPRQCFREAAKIGLILDPKGWFYFLDIRNLTVHTYSEKNVETVIESFDQFSLALDEFVNNLEKIK